MTDHAGHAIIVGSVVKLECTIVAINPSNPHFATVVVNPSFPATFVPSVNVTNTGPVPNNPVIPAQYAFDGSQLTWVSG